MTPLEEEIRDLVSQSGAEAVGIALKSPTRNLVLEIDAERPFHPASTFKVCVMMEAYRAHQEGEFSLDLSLPVVNKFQSLVDGSPYSLNAEDDSDPGLYDLLGHGAPARELVERMIVRSSNLATNILIEILRPQRVDAFMQQLGANGILVRRGVEDVKAYRADLNNIATARSLNTIVFKLLAGTVVSSESDSQMIEILLRQEFNDGIPKLLPLETKVAHKTGWNGPLYHDSGIIFPKFGNPYVLTVMTKGLSGEKEGPRLVAKVSQAIYNLLAD